MMITLIESFLFGSIYTNVEGVKVSDLTDPNGKKERRHTHLLDECQTRQRALFMSGSNRGRVRKG
jgi:hypothetical protein